MKKFNFSSKRGFTLIELLVVIGILAVLAAIAIPMVSGVIMKANVSSDKTNANEMTNSVERFASEYELYCQDIAAGKIKNTANLDSAQARVYNVTKATTRSDIEKLESEEGFNGRAIDGDTNYPTNRETAQAVIQTYEKTSSSTFEPKQSDMHYWYSPDCGIVVFDEPDASKSDLNAQVVSGKDASGQPLTQDTVWIDLTEESGSVNTPAPCGIAGHTLGDGKEHGIPAENCTAGHTYTCECDGWVIPEGCSYYIGMRDLQEGFYFNTAEKSYTAGQQLPCGYKIQNSDVFVDNHYRYVAETYASVFNENTGNWDYIETSPRWILESVSDKSLKTYGEIRETILSAPVIGLYGTFEGCESLETAPAIPNTVTYLYYVFHDCTSLKTAPVIPNSVTSLTGTFYGCTSLTTVPAIPKNVDDMTCTFQSCSSLTGTVEIHANPTTYDRCFNNTSKSIVLTGTSTILNELAQTGPNITVK